MNDGGYGVIKHIQDKLYDGRHFFGDLETPNLEQLAAVANMPYQRVSAAEQLGPAVSAGMAADGPALVEVDMSAVGTFPPYFMPPPYEAKNAG